MLRDSFRSPLPLPLPLPRLRLRGRRPCMRPLLWLSLRLPFRREVRRLKGERSLLLRLPLLKFLASRPPLNVVRQCGRMPEGGGLRCGCVVRCGCKQAPSKATVESPPRCVEAPAQQRVEVVDQARWKDGGLLLRLGLGLYRLHRLYRLGLCGLLLWMLLVGRRL